MNMRTLNFLLILIPVLIISLSGCASTTKTSVLVNSSDSVKIGYTQLKVLLFDFYDVYSSATEQSANFIIQNTDDTEIKKMALKWKINSIAEARRSLFIYDPFAALIDSRAYFYQLNQFFKSGNGKNYFGEYQYVAIETTESLIKGLNEIALQTFSEDKISSNQPEFDEWVSQNPILGPEFSRKSTISLFVKYLGEDSRNITSSLGSIEESVSDVRVRLTTYAHSLPKQVQWQAELMILENLERKEFNRALKDIDTIAVSLHEINQFIQELDDLLGNIANDSFSEVNRQRLATLDELKSERELLVNILQSERQIILDALILERKKTIDDAEKITKGLMTDSGVLMYDLIDHIFYRIIQLCAILVVLVFITILIMRKMKKT